MPSRRLDCSPVIVLEPAGRALFEWSAYQLLEPTQGTLRNRIEMVALYHFPNVERSAAHTTGMNRENEMPAHHLVLQERIVRPRVYSTRLAFKGMGIYQLLEGAPVSSGHIALTTWALGHRASPRLLSPGPHPVATHCITSSPRVISLKYHPTR